MWNIGALVVQGALGTKLLKASNLALANRRVIHSQDIDWILLLKTNLINTDNLLHSGVDTSLLTSCPLLDTHLRDAGLNSLSHTAKLLNLFDMSPSLFSNLLS